ncbi:MAG TPA: hypothetical protein VNZ58_15320 [Thermomicrobiales bacterium]|nr:hypothetical protein [Thermomicrobiales bacterium]
MGFVTRRFAQAGKNVSTGRFFAPPAPGAVKSPQVPGEVPDRSTIPDEGVLPVPAPAIQGESTRPLTQYGTAEEIMGVYQKKDVSDPNRFEQTPPSPEEQRKAFGGMLRTPQRPTAGYALAAGIHMPNNRLAMLQAQSRPERRFEPGE